MPTLSPYPLQLRDTLPAAVLPRDVLPSLAARPWTCRALLIAWCGLLFFYGLNVGELWRTESLRAIIAQEFLRSGNWIVPTLYGEPLFTKPPGMYAAIALCSLPFGGVTEWTARLPSALAATLSVLLFAWYFGRQLGRGAGLVAGLLLPLSLLWLDKATTAEIDMLQVFWITASILFFLRALEEYPTPDSPNLATRWTREKVLQATALRVSKQGAIVEQTVNHRTHAPTATPKTSRWLWWGLALLCVTGGTLTKWTGPAFFYLTALTLLWRRRQLLLMLRREHLVSAMVAASVCLAWAVWAISLTGWDIFYTTVFREASQRFSPQAAGRPYPLAETLRHPLVVLLAAFPVSVTAVLAMRPEFARTWDDRGRRLLQALHCWLWPNLLLWSVMTEHAPRHSLPMMPALAGMAAMVWVAWLNGRLSWPFPWFKPQTALVAILVGWLCTKAVFVHAVTPARSANREPRAKGELLAHLVPREVALYLFRLKDEGILFYFGRPALRLNSPADLPPSTTDMYCILAESEWTQWNPSRAAEAIVQLYDEQGDTIVLVRVLGNSGPSE